MAAKKGAGFDWDSIPTSSMYPNGYYNLEVVKTEVGESRNGYKQYTLEHQITEPKEYAGRLYWERFTIGNDADPEAEDPDTWKQSVGAQRLKKYLLAAKFKTNGQHPDELIPELEGVEVCAHLAIKIQTKGDYKGQEQQTSNFYALGEREPQLLADSDKPNARRVPRKRHEVDEEEAPAPTRRRTRVAEEEEEEEPVPRRRRRAAEEEEEEEEEEPVSRRARRKRS